LTESLGFVVKHLHYVPHSLTVWQSDSLTVWQSDSLTVWQMHNGKIR
jgi:hypothetical protein